MSILPKAEKGFSLVGLLVIIVAIGVLGVVGWHVFDNRNKHGSRATNATDAANTTDPTQTISTYFTIREWGVRAPYNGALALQYVISDPHSAALSSAQLAAGGPAVCSDVSAAEAGILGRYLPGDTNLGPKIPANETAQQYIDQNSRVPHAQVGGYIYIYWGGSYLTNGAYNGPCSNAAAAQQTIAAFSIILPELQSIK
ncbi:MAG TPA: hypothetical protein VLF91_01145 [Candidatus Saccharimonadales bacterium]|nr:hypothetical protein [Candidatus Saccharimonadales bacterium]